MTNRLDSKSVMIIGASKGIGKGIAEVFAKEGAHLLLVGRHQENLEKLASSINNQGGRANYCVGDISKEEDMHRAANEALSLYGNLDVLCQNAGIYPEARIEEMNSFQWHEVINTNLTGTFYAIKACLPALKKNKKGRIVVTSSISGPKVGLPGFSHYTASKAGINGFIRTIAIELAKYHITVNGVEPGNILTEGVEELGTSHIKEMERAIPMGKLGTPEDIAYATLFLASDGAKYITGQTIVVDGGQILPETHFARF